MFRRRDWASLIIQAELTGKKIAEAGSVQYETIVREKPKTTEIYAQKDLTLDSNSVFVDVKGYGKVHEIFLMTDSQNYKIYVNVDGKDLYDDTYSHLSEMSRFLNEIGTRTSGSYYILSIVDIPFSTSLYIRVEPSESIVFKEVSIKYEVGNSV